MACGYQMTFKMFQRDLGHLNELSAEPIEADWPFAGRLKDLKSPNKQDDLLALLQKGHAVQF